MFRKILFWMHLCSGVSAGLVILMMSLTGVMLTYERQLLAFEDRVYDRTPLAEESRLPLDTLLGLAQSLDGFEPDRLTLARAPATAIEFAQGRGRSEFLDPYTGSVYTQHDGSMAALLANVRGWHRWFNLSGEERAKARVITGASNLLFLFLLCSGIYLWLPAIINRTTMRLRVWFHPLAKSGAARDFNWHHVFGFWAVLPLIVIVATATVFYYPWANALVYQLAGDEVPTTANISAEPVIEVPVPAYQPIALDRVVQIASAQVADWNSLAITLPTATSAEYAVTIDQGNGRQPQLRHTLSLHADSGVISRWAPFSSQSAGRQARAWVRFLHTGEALGGIGQTLAGIASLAAVLMVWTGLALSWRRLRAYLARARRQRQEALTAVTAVDH